MSSSTTEVATLDREVSVNVNHKVRVQLTERGREVLAQGIMNAHSLTREQAEQTITTCHLHDDGYEFQMYEFMRYFGWAYHAVATTDPEQLFFEGNRLIMLPDAWTQFAQRD